MSAATVQLLTAKEFARLPSPSDGSRLELERGEVIKVSQPRHLHGRTQLRIGHTIESFLGPNPIGHATSGSGILTESDPDTVRGPDLAYWSIERLPLDADPELYTSVPPDLAIEILSPSNTPRQMVKKIKEYFQHGVRMVWIVDADFRSVTVYRKPGKGTILWEDELVSGEDVLPGFSCRVGDLFPPVATKKAPENPA